jgi:hypothetical protein
MKGTCKPFFVIPRGNTSRYIYLFQNKGDYYDVTLKVLYGNLPYKKISTVRILNKNILTYINTVVANTY